MWNVADASLIEEIWRALNSPSLKSRPQVVTELLSKFVEEGVAEVYDVENLLWAMVPHFPDSRTSEIAKALGIQLRAVYPKPKARQRQVLGSMSMSCADVAVMLISLERLGFEVDPSLLVDQLLPSVKSTKRLDNSELSVLWFHRERHKQSPLTFVQDPKATGHKKEELRTRTQYRIELWRDDQGRATMLEAYAPKYRHRRSYGWAA